MSAPVLTSFLAYSKTDGRIHYQATCPLSDISEVRSPDPDHAFLALTTPLDQPWKFLVIDGALHENTLAEYTPWPPR